MMLSRFLRTRERDGWTVIFHELHPVPLYIQTFDWKSFIDNQEKYSQISSELLERKLLVKDAAEDDAELKQTRKRVLEKLSRPNILYLLLAQDCNYRCVYCPVPGQAKKWGSARMSMEDANAGLRVWCDHQAEQPRSSSGYIIFYGGEPLLNKPTFFGAVQEIQSLRSQGELTTSASNLCLATNGSLIDNDVLRVCREADILVALGLDGLQTTNDQLRVSTDGSSSFQQTVYALKLLQKAGVRTAVSTTITPKNIDDIDRMIDMLEDIGVTNYGFNFLKGKAQKELIPAEKNEEFERSATELVMRQHRRRPDYQIQKKFRSFKERDFFPIDCTCYGNQIVVRANGMLSHCPFSQTDIGHVQSVPRDFRISQSSIVQQWRQRLPILQKAEPTHDFVALMGPGCAFGALEKGQSLTEADSNLDDFSKTIFEDLIWSECPTERK